ncbi:X-Pro dipeptidyl-peptidase [Sphingobacterium siyangense]|uniref:CocE/NonD family hydrolase n=2 Tax=Sphingobacterium TaxID=28453 RepID=A0ABX7CNX6_SPHMU|nr:MULTISPECIES: CocE/NonD family hydrolase [Sphingobacterium]QQT30269.1 CocE/NonD family hydrolase [Sphingobacterium multivorum]QQT53762.1 CocE/NonD family hydrolase [Sphingobacterium multivorum]QRY58922.1 CocE/NonD family hydrolase [Sphingobacterium siyangense]RKF33974.1 X-Pro dipeptidyl-peptidase [Sphingobacterium siyangense]
MRLHLMLALTGLILSLGLRAQNTAQDSVYVYAHYTKQEIYIPMRDGKKLYTAIYTPRDTAKSYPIMMMRTPYSIAPYGEQNFRIPIGPSMEFVKEKFIFVYQDVRGKYKSEGDFIANRPYTDTPGAVNESTDTYDTIDWLVKQLKSNGNVGIWGISSPGMYASMSLIDSHPALRAVSPQAPVTDWFLGDDRHHNGAFMLMGSFSFLSSFGKKRDSIGSKGPAGFSNYGTDQAYSFFLKAGALANLNQQYLKGESVLWNEMMSHPNYDDYWTSRAYLSRIRELKPQVLVVGGWFDQEDLYGPLKTYQALQKIAPDRVKLVMGPWYHGSWSRGSGRQLDSLDFGQNTASYYRKEIELPFFVSHLKGQGKDGLAAATVFVTGENNWSSHRTWPVEEVRSQPLFLTADRKLSLKPAPKSASPYVSYISDPSKPVPYTREKTVLRGYKYMYEDQFFAAQRPDVLVFETEVLEQDVKLMGNIQASLFVSSTGSDADFVVKLIDVHPYKKGDKLSDCQCLIRGEVMRAKYRKSFAHPEAMKPNRIEEVHFDMQDAAHVFKKGHKIMVQIQSSWFPLVDRNPQQFMNIYEAADKDFKTQEHRIYCQGQYASFISLPIVTSHEN